MSNGVDVVALGNALVDILSHEPDSFIERLGLTRGVATMVGTERADEVYAAMGPAIEVSGGSAANTVAGLASFGARCAFVGKVRDDQMGTVFRHDLNSLGVLFPTPPATSGPPTGRCMVVVTPDAERTMTTNLGIAVELSPDDIDVDTITGAKIIYLEGFLWDQPAAKAAIRKASTIAVQGRTKVALTLSDPFCVNRHRDEFLDLVSGHVDILFANEEEICSLFGTDSVEDAVTQVRAHCELAALTLGAKGSLMVSGDTEVRIRAEQVSDVVDTTGAGDQYAAGFLYGYVQAHDLATCGRLGSLAAAEVISHMGARPVVSLADLASSYLDA